MSMHQVHAWCSCWLEEGIESFDNRVKHGYDVGLGIQTQVLWKGSECS